MREGGGDPGALALDIAPGEARPWFSVSRGAAIIENPRPAATTIPREPAVVVEPIPTEHGSEVQVGAVAV